VCIEIVYEGAVAGISTIIFYLQDTLDSYGHTYQHELSCDR